MMLVLDPIDNDDLFASFGKKVVVRTEKDGKKPYLFAYSPLWETKTVDGEKYFSYGRDVTSLAGTEIKSVRDVPRYVYSIKDLKHFKSAVRLRHMTLEDFITKCFFMRAGYDPETMEEWYVCAADQGRLTN